MTEYAEREIDSNELAPHYARHVHAMTAEGLHSKSAIVGELAYRDARIAELEAETDAAADYAQDHATLIELVSKALGVPEEPHQGRGERILEAAEALAAHAERLTAWIKEHGWHADSCDLLELDEDGKHKPCSCGLNLINETPTTSLARLKAECWKEAYLAGMEYGHHWTVEGGYVPGDEEAAEDYVADRQAEGGDHEN